jgi:LPS sulfotransferase NodH
MKGFLDGYKRNASGARGSPSVWRAAFRFRLGIDAAREAVRESGNTPRGILGVARNAAWPAIRDAYRKLVMKVHPDHGGDAATFRKVQGAYEVLEDAHTRGQLHTTA